jgi:hypothetical protein
MTLEAHNKLTDLKALAKVIYWLSDGATPYQHDLAERVNQISAQASKLAEDALDLASEIERNTDHE